jgi:RNA polymerase sigma-70 factor (ECF subfamily)
MDADSKAGRLKIVAQIYRARLPEFCRVAAAISGSREAAPDLVQEAFVRAVRGIDSFRGDGPLEGWLWRIVVNVAKNGHREPVAVALPAREHEVDSPPATTTHAEFAAALSALSERQRLVLFLRYYADLDYGTIAHTLSISGGTVGATLTAARTALGRALEGERVAP